ncbi:unnamed protein product [Adineta steineri]|uniref:PKS/mFAS DH domain-containing protein n=1 Tax=Adineta steineri TaxID=433720 RepID=A0A814U9A3_9BILA|nr:unnamed protein product [Adineta steineri]CAF1202791.1 unnamed protein product [Adineta steineri]
MIGHHHYLLIFIHLHPIFYDVTLQENAGEQQETSENNYIAVCAKAKLYSSVTDDNMPLDSQMYEKTVRFYDAITLIIKDEAKNVFLETSPHPVLVKSTRECYELTNQQQSSPPLILLTLKRKENEQTNHKIQDAILFPAVAYLELATAACHQLLSSKDDQKQPTISFEDVKFVKALILNKHKLIEVFTLIIMPIRQ